MPKPTLPTRNRGGRPRVAVKRDVIIHVRSEPELMQRLDAMALVRGRSSRSNLVELYCARAVEQDEAALGLLGSGVPAAMEAPAAIESLSSRVRDSVMEIYERLNKLSAATAQAKTARGQENTPPVYTPELQMRTFVELRDRMDAMMLVRSYANRSDLVRYYILRALQADEGALGIQVNETPMPLDPLPAFEHLSQRVRDAVLAFYSRMGKVPTKRETPTNEKALARIKKLVAK